MKQLHQPASQLLQINNPFFYSSGIGQFQANLRVLEFRPKNTGCVQQLKASVNTDPLLPAGNSGTVFGFCAFLSRYLVDQRGFSHVGDPYNHHPNRSAHSPGGITFQLLRAGFSRGGREIRNPLSGFTVRRYDGHSLLPEEGFPPLRGGRIRQIHAVENDNTGFPGTDYVNIGIPAGNRDARIHDFTYGIHLFQIRFDLAPGFGHMTGIPLDIHLVLTIHYPIAPILPKSLVRFPPSVPGIIRKMALPRISLRSTCPISGLRLSLELFRLSPITK